MKVLFTKTPRLLLAFLFLQGCTTKNPEWLTSPAGAYCASGLSDTCLKAFAEKAYADATGKQVAAHAAATARLAQGEGEGGKDSPANQEAASVPPQVGDGNAVDAAPGVEAVSDKAGQVEDVAGDEKAKAADPVKPHEVVEKVGDSKTEELAQSNEGSKAASPPSIPEGSIPNLAFGIAAIGATAAGADGYLPSERVIQSKEAGAILNVGTGPVTDLQLEQAGKISDKELRADALSGLLSLHSRSMSEDQVNSVLNELYALDKRQYENALIVKLPGLLKAGDLERARALRGVLLSVQVPSDSPLSMLAFVASCYTMAGMKQDAGAIVQDFFQGGGELSADDQRLINLSISVSNGSYPMMQDFYDFKSDGARLSAYLTIAFIARQLDNTDVARRAVADAVKFIQKAAVKLDRAKALSQILAISPGVI